MAAGSVVSGGSTLVVEVAEVSGKVPDADDEAPSSAGVDVVLSKGGAFSMYEPPSSNLKITA